MIMHTVSSATDPKMTSAVLVSTCLFHPTNTSSPGRTSSMSNTSASSGTKTKSSVIVRS